MMHLVALALPVGSHLGGWRHPAAFPDSVTNLEAGIEIAQLAERGKFDLLFLADGNGVRQLNHPALFEANAPTARPGWFEPLTYFAAVAMTTRHIGLVATATTTYEEPFLLARKFASLDHISKGRAGWNIVTTSEPDDALNFGRSEHMPRDARYERAREFVSVVKDLWDSWAPDAFVQDQSTGRYLDAAKVHVLNHKGKYFSVRGPLNVARSPQGRPLLFNAGQSEDGKEIAAWTADCVFAQTDTKEVAKAFYADVKGRLRKYGRSPESLKIIPGVSAFVGRTSQEARDLYDELAALISPALGVHYLSKMVETDLTKYPIEGPMPAIEGAITGFNTARLTIGQRAKREGLSIRQTYEWVVPTLGHPLFLGSPTEIADLMQDWYEDQACDGFMVQVPVVPLGLQNFVELVVPELQRRGLCRTEYTGSTLRENMGLPIPRNTQL